MRLLSRMPLVTCIVALAIGCNGDNGDPTGDDDEIPEGFFAQMYVNGSPTHDTFAGFACVSPWSLDDWAAGTGDPYLTFYGASGTPSGPFGLLAVEIQFYESELAAGGPVCDETPACTNSNIFVSPNLSGTFLNAGAYEVTGEILSWVRPRGVFTFSYKSLLDGVLYEIRDGEVNLAVPATNPGCPLE